MTSEPISKEIENLLVKMGAEGSRLWKELGIEASRQVELRIICNRIPEEILDKAFRIASSRNKWAIHILTDFHDLVINLVHENPPCGVQTDNLTRGDYNRHFHDCPFHGLWSCGI